MPASVSRATSRLSVMPCSNTYLAMQREAFPHMAPREPSALYMNMRKSATVLGPMSTSPSEPTPK